MSDRCKSCGAAVRWVVMATSQKRMPLDAVPSASGTIIIDGDGTARVDAGPGRAKFTSHFATCPQAAQHRRRR